jgi:hypothetical protein
MLARRSGLIIIAMTWQKHPLSILDWDLYGMLHLPDKLMNVIINEQLPAFISNFEDAATITAAGISAETGEHQEAKNENLSGQTCP